MAWANAELQRRHRAAIRDQALAKLGAACARCDIADVRVLQFDHIHPGRGRHANRRSYATHMEVIKGSKNIQLLCANCHAIKTYKEANNDKDTDTDTDSGTGTRDF